MVEDEGEEEERGQEPYLEVGAPWLHVYLSLMSRGYLRLGRDVFEVGSFSAEKS